MTMTRTFTTHPRGTILRTTRLGAKRVLQMSTGFEVMPDGTPFGSSTHEITLREDDVILTLSEGSYTRVFSQGEVGWIDSYLLTDPGYFEVVW